MPRHGFCLTKTADCSCMVIRPSLGHHPALHGNAHSSWWQTSKLYVTESAKNSSYMWACSFKFVTPMQVFAICMLTFCLCVRNSKLLMVDSSAVDAKVGKLIMNFQRRVGGFKHPALHESATEEPLSAQHVWTDEQRWDKLRGEFVTAAQNNWTKPN